MADRRIESISRHATHRLAQRNLSAGDIEYVVLHGRALHTGKATFVYLGARDIPHEDRRKSQCSRLEGTVLVLDPETGTHLTTAYRNRRTGLRDIKRKTKCSIRFPA